MSNGLIRIERISSIKSISQPSDFFLLRFCFQLQTSDEEVDGEWDLLFWGFVRRSKRLNFALAVSKGDRQGGPMPEASGFQGLSSE
jgi:hypothetical protein